MKFISFQAWSRALIFVFVALPFARVSASRAEGLRLEEALADALQNSPKLQRANSQKEEASWKQTEALSYFLPTVSANASYLLAKKYLLTDVTLPSGSLTIPQIIPTTNFAVVGQLAIFDGWASGNRWRSAREMKKAAADDADWVRFQVEREVTTLFYRALGARALKDVAEQSVKMLEEHLRNIQLTRKAGVSTNYDVLRVEVQVSEARSELLNASDNAEIAREKWLEALGHENDAREPLGKLPSPHREWIDRIAAAGVESAHRKDISALEARSFASSELEAASSVYWVPRVSLFGQIQSYNNRNDQFANWDSFRGAYQVGLSLNWNLFDGLASISKSKQAIEQRYQAEKTLQISKLRAKQDFEMWKRKFLYQCSVFQSRQSDVQKATESVRLASEGRRAGIQTNSDLLDAETELFRAQAGLVNSQMGAIEAITNLELATGEKIADFKQE